jgi:hypothetical protein
VRKVPCFFGYGSLVNTKTHGYPDPIKARLSGWRRMWRHTTMRELAILSVVPDPDVEIAGLIASVPNNDWAALDEREVYYSRAVLDANSLTYQGDYDVQMYEVETDKDAQALHSILLSYLDVVVQGFLEQFGEDGVAAFFETTSGWDAPILNDRAAPLYPRAQVLTSFETGLVDAHLQALFAQVEKR